MISLFRSLSAALLLIPSVLFSQSDYEYIGPNGGRTVSLSMTSNGTLYIAVAPDISSPPSLFRMRTGERRWERIEYYDSLTQANGQSAAIFAFDPVVVLLHETEGVSISHDEGETWEKISRFIGSSYNGFHPHARGGSLFIRALDGLYRSDDSGRTWRLEFSQIRHYLIGMGDAGLYMTVHGTGTNDPPMLVRRDPDGTLVTITPSDGYLAEHIVRGDTLMVSYRDSDTSDQQFYQSTDAERAGGSRSCRYEN